MDASTGHFHKKNQMDFNKWYFGISAHALCCSRIPHNFFTYGLVCSVLCLILLEQFITGQFFCLISLSSTTDFPHLAGEWTARARWRFLLKPLIPRRIYEGVPFLSCSDHDKLRQKLLDEFASKARPPAAHPLFSSIP